MEKTSFLDYEQYYRSPEPSLRQKAYNWSAAIGLQDVDGLAVSPYLKSLAKDNIEGRINSEEVSVLLSKYYESKDLRKEENSQMAEADMVSARIVEILNEPSFSLSSAYYQSIHKRLFHNIYDFAGHYRSYGISKKEWVLGGASVLYGAPFELSMALNYDLERERNFSYKSLSLDEVIRHFCQFLAKLWQIHAFGEGNTRTTAVFAIQYLRYLGFRVDNTIFQENSWYFRNALVRANYNDVRNGIHETTEYLERFFRNFLLGEQNELRNRYLHIAYSEKEKSSEKTEKSSEKTSVLVLEFLRENPFASARSLAEKLSLQPRSIEKQIAALKKRGLLKREGSARNGKWIVVE